MFYMILSAIIGLVLGFFVGYFMTLPILVICSVAIVCIARQFFKDTSKPGRGHGSAGIGIVMIFGPGIICFFVTAWIAWFFAPSGIAYDIDFRALWDSIRPYLFR